MVFLNHGSFGAAPSEVLAVQEDWRRRLERQPCRFMRRTLPEGLRQAAAVLAGFLGARADDVVFVENTTAGINAVLRSLRFAAGDEVVVTDHVYNAVRNTLRFVLAGTGASLRVARVGMPVASEAQILDAVLPVIGPRTRLAVIDHVASPSAVRFPVDAIAERCRAVGAALLVDGAHAPGMLDLDVPATGADWYVGNAHKWLCAPKGSAFLWARADRQEGLHPTVISHDLGLGFTAEFDKVGTRDGSAWLAVPAAVRFHERLGGRRLRERNRALAVEAGHWLAAELGTETGAADTLFGSMATVRLPVRGATDRAAADALRDRLWDADRIEAQIVAFAGALWVRLSIQAYNTMDDVHRLAEALSRRAPG